jgi:hypothetical protein
LRETAGCAADERLLTPLSKFSTLTWRKIPISGIPCMRRWKRLTRAIDFIHNTCLQQSHASEHRKLASSKKQTNLLRASTMRRFPP